MKRLITAVAIAITLIPVLNVQPAKAYDECNIEGTEITRSICRAIKAEEQATEMRAQEIRQNKYEACNAMVSAFEEAVVRTTDPSLSISMAYEESKCNQFPGLNERVEQAYRYIDVMNTEAEY